MVLVVLLLLAMGPAHLLCRTAVAAPSPCTGGHGQSAGQSSLLPAPHSHWATPQVPHDSTGPTTLAAHVPPASTSAQQSEPPAHSGGGIDCDVCMHVCHKVTTLAALEGSTAPGHDRPVQPATARVAVGIEVAPLPRPPDATA